MSAWKTLGHDSQRTGAEPDGDITSLSEQWNRKMGTNSYGGWAGCALGDESAIYGVYSEYNGATGGKGTRIAINRYDASGTPIWINKNSIGSDSTHHTWPYVTGTYVFIHDAELQRIDAATGVVTNIKGHDNSGDIVFNAAESQYFTASQDSAEGLWGGIWVRSYTPTWTDTTKGLVWIRNEEPSTVNVLDRNRIAVAYDNSTFFYAPDYYVWVNDGSWTNQSGIYAWNDAGTLQWFQATTPTGKISAGNSLVYMYENANSLVARNQSDGTVAFTKNLTGTILRGTPPVLADGKVIVATSTGVYAFNNTTGAPAWSNAILNINFGYSGYDMYNTVMAAALVSNTLVVTAQAGVYVLSLTDGSQQDFYAPPSLTDRPANPTIIQNRVYITDAFHDYSNYSYYVLICLQDGVAIPPPPDTTAPSTPGTPTFSSVGETSMTVSWTASTDNIAVASYNLFYREAGGTWNSILKTVTNHTFSNLQFSTTYEFYVNAVDTSGNTSSNSATASQATATPTPSITLTGSVTNKTIHTLSWTNLPGTKQLQRKVNKGGQSYSTIYTGESPYSYNNTDLKSSYTYRLVLDGTYYSNEVTLKSTRK